MSKKVWNVMHVPADSAGGGTIAFEGNPLQRSVALAKAEQIAGGGLVSWVEHHQTGRRLYESPVERARKDWGDQINRAAKRGPWAGHAARKKYEVTRRLPQRSRYGRSPRPLLQAAGQSLLQIVDQRLS